MCLLERHQFLTEWSNPMQCGIDLIVTSFFFMSFVPANTRTPSRSSTSFHLRCSSFWVMRLIFLCKCMSAAALSFESFSSLLIYFLSKGKLLLSGSLFIVVSRYWISSPIFYSKEGVSVTDVFFMTLEKARDKQDMWAVTSISWKWSVFDPQESC